MPITLITSKKQIILVEDLPLANPGGEGAVHKIISPSRYSNCCVKLYFRQYRDRKHERKIQYMIQNPVPDLNGLKNGGGVICFPIELVYENNKSNRFAGFIMPLAFDGSHQLYELCIPTTKKLSSDWISKYDRCSSKGIESRLKLCVNIAAAINFIHSTGNYVLVDLKPQNILITSDGKISVIDLDSTQIANNNQVLYPAQVATPEYIPVEGNHLNPSKDLIPETWDRFSLAVVFYEILFGLHPYAASYQGQYQNSNTVADSIRYGLFVHGSKKSFVYRKPPLHNNFGYIPASLQNLFIKAFDEGHNNPSLRPKADEWGRIIYSEIRKSTLQLKGFTPTINSNRIIKSKVVTYNTNQTKLKTNANQTKIKTNTNQPKKQSSLYNQKQIKNDLHKVGKIVAWTISLIILFYIATGALSLIGSIAQGVGDIAQSIKNSFANLIEFDSNYNGSNSPSLCPIESTGYLTTNVKLRKNPSTKYKNLAIHYRGAKVQILEIKEGEPTKSSSYWYRVKILSKGCHAEKPSVCGSEGSATEGWMHSAVISCN